MHVSIDSRAVGQDLGVNVVEPAGLRAARANAPLLVFLHGHGGSEESYIEDEAVFEGLARLGHRAPLIAFPDGGDNGYWHDRAEGDWEAYVMREVIPTVSRRFGIDPDRVAIGGISMGGFGAYDLALHHPGRFCAVGGHSAALWFEGGETAPGAFDDAEDFERNDVVGTVRADPDAFGPIPVWNDYGDEDPFRAYNEGFVAGAARRRRRPQHPLMARRPRALLLGPPTGLPTCASTPTPAELERVALFGHRPRKAPHRASDRASRLAACRAGAAGPSFRVRRWSKSGSSVRPSPGCRG